MLKTPQIDRGSLLNYQEAFLLSKDADYVNGQVIPIDGGQSVAY